MMELFTLGADRGAYTERDVREQARALTGFRNDWSAEPRTCRLPLRPAPPRPGRQDDLPPPGRSTWRDSCRLCVDAPAPRVVLRPEALELLRARSRRTRDAGGARAALRRLDYEVRPVVEAILRHPALYNGPRMVKPPVVYIAGLLRRSGAGSTPTAWTWLDRSAGQQLFYPPNVAGWNDTRWLDTATLRGALVDRGRRARPVCARIAAHAHQPDDAKAAPRPGLRRSGTTRRSARDATRTLTRSHARSLADANAAGSASSTRRSSRTRCAS